MTVLTITQAEVNVHTFQKRQLKLLLQIGNLFVAVHYKKNFISVEQT